MHLYVFLFSALVSVILIQNQVEAQEPVVVPRPNPAIFPGKCFHAETGNAYSPGESWNDLTQCVQYTCNQGNFGNVFIQTARCDLAQFQPGCRIIENTRATYPACCPRVACPNDY